jgi:hypothetical protein
MATPRLNIGLKPRVGKMFRLRSDWLDHQPSHGCKIQRFDQAPPQHQPNCRNRQHDCVHRNYTMLQVVSNQKIIPKIKFIVTINVKQCLVCWQDLKANGVFGANFPNAEESADDRRTAIVASIERDNKLLSHASP